MSRGIHTRPNDGATVNWLTPPSLLHSLGTFDLDPCSHPGQIRTAKIMIAPPQDGLKHHWQGRVWLNPPYGSQLHRWMNAMAAHNHGTALVPSRTEVEKWFWPYVWESATAILFLRGRISFYLPDGSTKGNAGHGSVLAAYGEEDAARLADSGIAGKWIRL